MAQTLQTIDEPGFEPEKTKLIKGLLLLIQRRVSAEL